MNRDVYHVHVFHGDRHYVIQDVNKSQPLFNADTLDKEQVENFRLCLESVFNFLHNNQEAKPTSVMFDFELDREKMGD